MAKDYDFGITIIHDPNASATAGKSQAHEIAFDLVAIHGLNGDPFRTWTHPETAVMWLRDLLPEAIPNIRIMTFGYNPRFKNFTDKSGDLCLATAKALVMGCTEARERVQESVCGILFLGKMFRSSFTPGVSDQHSGTPHKASSPAAMGKVLANIVFAFSPIRAPLALIRTFKEESELLLEITEDFLQRRERIHLVSFYELESTSIGPFLRKLIVEQRSAIFNVPLETTVPQFADHKNIARFSSSEDRSFLPVLSQLKEFARVVCSDRASRTRSFTATDQNKGRSLGYSVRHADSQTEPSIPFDVDIQPCSSLRGREDIFDMLSRYFRTDQTQAPTRRTFGICGLGGVGKTQIALHYALQNLSKYKSGVAFINATSPASLSAHFDRLNDLLRLGDSRDKIGAVRSWLSRPENSSWLLVFDNANDLNTAPLHKYFPAVNWGHIIITSRDQAVIGSIADDGHVLNHLGENDAVQLLLQKSGIQHPTEDALEDAKKVAGLLGYLPLALVQAGAFVRSRHRSLGEYRKLYMTRRDDLLNFAPRLGTGKAVLATWETNFKQVELESSGAACLLYLFSFLQPFSIPEVLLQRGSCPQKRWSEDGEITEISAENEGVETELVKVIQDVFEFDTAVEKLLSFSLISCKRESGGLRSFSIHPLVQHCAARRLSPSDVRKWRWQALLLVCHAFPRSRYLDPLNGEVGRTLLPHLSRVISEYDAMCLEHGDQVSFRFELASTLLAASRFSNAKWKFEAIDRTKKLLEGNYDPFLNAWLAYRESSVRRMSGDQEESENVLHRFPRDTAAPKGEELEPSRRYNAQRGELIISFAENLIREGKFAEAKTQLLQWEPLGIPPSSLEKITSRARDITLGKILRFRGLFTEAHTLLDRILQGCLLEDYFEGTGWYRVLLSEVADLLCELNQPDEAEKLLLHELNPMRERGTQNIATGRRLQLSLAETYLQRNMFAEAEELLLELQRAFSLSGEPGYNVKFNNFRVWSSLARNSHKQLEWERALPRWREALSALGALGLDGSFNAGIVRCSIAHALLMTACETESASMLQEAKTNMATDDRVYWIPMFNSNWHEYIIKTIEEHEEKEQDV
ncbi:predicted protein [Uncinocarpus reesii 1704]|uniref:DUF7779 domain-containing protein n=1 Tax=Uncinocarpus reesii (strain UAMH 1704) TaxID=336963 RepID=C4JIP8_UNCRE|nr:uncharacterized protein UREG_02909 [Uncinocarpus reesii 1704]EEP78060.1 predicted protein [Uncinocarpus reesii 1704]